MSNRYSIYEIEQLKAIASRLERDDVYFEGKVRRWYSKNFNTSLTDTFNLSWAFILRQYYESNLEDMDYNKVYDIAIDNYLSEISESLEEENQAYADSLIDEQNASLDASKTLKKGSSCVQKEFLDTKAAEQKECATEPKKQVFEWDFDNPDEDDEKL